jgi:hypothetical protein
MAVGPGHQVVVPGAPPAPVATDDRGLMAAVRSTLGAQGRPPLSWHAAALAAARWLAIEDDVADTRYDSTGDEGTGFAGLRSAGTVVRQLGFAGTGSELEIEMAVTPDLVRVVGRLVPGRRAAVRALGLDEVHLTDADAAGVFRFDRLPLGPVSFHVMGDGGLKTCWLTP